MLRSSALQWGIAIILSAPGAASATFATQWLAVGAELDAPSNRLGAFAMWWFDLWLDSFRGVFAAAFFLFWIAFTMVALTGKTPNAVFRRTCGTYASAAFFLPVAAVIWSNSGPASVGGSYGIFGGDFGVFVFAFLFGVATGVITLLLGFYNFQGPVPGIDSPPSGRIP